MDHIGPEPGLFRGLSAFGAGKRVEGCVVGERNGGRRTGMLRDSEDSRILSQSTPCRECDGLFKAQPLAKSPGCIEILRRHRCSDALKVLIVSPLTLGIHTRAEVVQKLVCSAE